MPKSIWPYDKKLRYAMYRRFKFISVTIIFPDLHPLDIPNLIDTDN